MYNLTLDKTKEFRLTVYKKDTGMCECDLFKMVKFQLNTGLVLKVRFFSNEN